MEIITKAIIRYHQDAEFHANVYRVIGIMENDKPTPLTDDERSIITIAAALAIELTEKKEE